MLPIPCKRGIQPLTNDTLLPSSWALSRQPHNGTKLGTQSQTQSTTNHPSTFRMLAKAWREEQWEGSCALSRPPTPLSVYMWADAWMHFGDNDWGKRWDESIDRVRVKVKNISWDYNLWSPSFLQYTKTVHQNPALMQKHIKEPCQTEPQINSWKKRQEPKLRSKAPASV